MAKPSGSSPVRAAERPADVEQHAAAGDRPGDRLDAGDAVALAGDDVARAAAVPGHGRGRRCGRGRPTGWSLQRHEDHVVGAAEAVREALVPRSASRPVSSIVCTGLVRRRQPVLRAVRVERLREREGSRRGGRARRPRAAWRRRGSSACRARRRRPSGPSWSSRSPPPRSPLRGPGRSGTRPASRRRLCVGTGTIPPGWETATVRHPAHHREDEMSDEGHQLDLMRQARSILAA